MSIEIKDFTIKDQSIKPPANNPELKKILELMPAGSFDLLPKSRRETLSVVFKNTFSGFVNGLRRALVEELPVSCLDIDEKNISTDDEFILLDVLMKNINLLPIKQDIDDLPAAVLDVRNETLEILDVYASDIKPAGFIPDSNIVIARLRPGKSLHMSKFYIARGYGMHDAGRFSLLDNVKYKPLDITPYDGDTDTGTRSTEKDCHEFALSFTTAGNCSALYVLRLCCDELTTRLERCLKKVEAYGGTGSFTSDNFEVAVNADLYTYKFHNEYITLSYMIAQRCFVIDPNTPYVAPTVDRYDNNIAVIKIKHADSRMLMMAAIKANIGDLAVIKKSK
jgi:hypothetical protein